MCDLLCPVLHLAVSEIKQTLLAINKEVTMPKGES